MLWRYRKGLRKRRHPSASLAPSSDAHGGCGLPWVLCQLVWDEKWCFQLRCPAGKVVSQVLDAVGASPRDNPKGRGAVEQEGKKGESPTSCFVKEVTKVDKCLGQDREQWESVSECKDRLDAGRLSMLSHKLLRAGAFQGEAKKQRLLSHGLWGCQA